MWCTRWFLPLLLLPLPTAPPYFLVLFLFTLALHGRPCFYCVILLGALFLSSCYWQSFPLDAPLSVPWADDITTFYEALNATISPGLDLHEFRPPIIRVADRCWCDFASGVFEPYDVQRWERDSVERAVAEMERQWKARFERDAEVDVGAKTNGTVVEVDLGTPTPSTLDEQQDRGPVAQPDSGVGKETLSILRSLFSKRYPKDEPLPTSSSSVFGPSDACPSSPAPHVETEPSHVPTLPVQSSLSPWQVDMRSLGFDVILDFRWSRRA
ncbi:hypothetical protein F5I97DRAFT_1930186 [Phlebopus sp. FC_14]|nr:hypothetical protein F5I97DRAFT_1930186 [Phlebopus sp. FC_14]